ncbi:hypothetical protein MAR_014529 [Mya arenaria]|uniref:Uncharacterized protein n=1 Tax=Mya arenaria TaxID=6604 RepID=A0ABY7G315_MYAAR|nr:hypothetical protein MAR_014529 [Mya arenaria]
MNISVSVPFSRTLSDIAKSVSRSFFRISAAFLLNNEATSDLFRRRQGPHLLPVLSPTASLPNSRSVSANPPVAIVF